MSQNDKNLSVKALKNKVDDDGSLDLGMMELRNMPARNLLQVPKAIKLDLSQNFLETLPIEFCSLKHLVQINLSENGLRLLPDDFGRLSNLRHLDLYKNKLETLPTSFCELKQLKWLDLKDNPLEDGLNQAAGNCLTTDECQKAARNVLKYMSSVAEREKVERIKLEHLKNQQREAQLREEAENKAATKKKKKEDRKKEFQEKQQQKKEISNGVLGERQEKKVKTNEGGPDGGKEKRTSATKSPAAPAKNRSILGRIFSAFCYLTSTIFLLALLAFFFAAGALYVGCSEPEKSRETLEVCNDLHRFLATKQVPEGTEERVKILLGRKLDSFYHWSIDLLEAVKTADYEKLMQSCRDSLLGFGTWARTKAADGLAYCQKLWKSKLQPGSQELYHQAVKFSDWLGKQTISRTRQLLNYYQQGLATLVDYGQMGAQKAVDFLYGQ